jgi:hypothetical protein
MEHLALGVDESGPGRPQHQGADGVRETAGGLGDALSSELGWRLVIGRQQHIERRAVPDLGIEHAGRAECKFGFVSGVLVEGRGDPVHGRREVGRHCHLDLTRASPTQRERGERADADPLP